MGSYDIPPRHYLVHDSDLASIEGYVIGIYSGVPPLMTPDDMDRLGELFDHIRSHHEDLMGIEMDGGAPDAS